MGKMAKRGIWIVIIIVAIIVIATMALFVLKIFRGGSVPLLRRKEEDKIATETTQQEQTQQETPQESAQTETVIQSPPESPGIIPIIEEPPDVEPGASELSGNVYFLPASIFSLQWNGSEEQYNYGTVTEGSFWDWLDSLWTLVKTIDPNMVIYVNYTSENPIASVLDLVEQSLQENEMNYQMVIDYEAELEAATE